VKSPRWLPPHRPRWHDWMDSALIAYIALVDTLWLVLR
jgi:hypothetical protein